MEVKECYICNDEKNDTLMSNICNCKNKNIHKRLTKPFFVAKQSDPYITSKRMPRPLLLNCWDLLNMTCILFSQYHNYLYHPTSYLLVT